MSETETYEQSDDQLSATEIEEQRQPHRGGKGGHHKREEPTSLIELQACPWQYHVSSTCLATNFARGSLGFSTIESWPAFLSYTCMMDMSTLQG